MSKSKVLLLGSLSVLLVGLVGCASNNADNAGASSGSDKITLTVTSSMVDEARVNTMNETIKIFNQTHPNVTIQYSPSPWSEYAQNLKLAFNSGAGQDIVYLDDTMQQMLQKNNYLMDITDDVKSRGWIDKEVEGAIDFQNARTPGKYYSIPYMAAPIVVYYNKDIFSKLNLTPPKTIDEFNSILAKVKEAGYVPMENGGMSNMPKMWSVFHMLYNQTSADDIKKFYFQQGITPEFEKTFTAALNQVKEWENNGYYRKEDASIDGSAVPTYYAKGQSAMVLGGNWDIPNYEGTNIPTGAFAFPQQDANSQSHTIVNATDGGWALNAELSAEKKQAALDFIETFMNPEVVKLWYEGGSTPTIKADMSGAQVSDLKKEVDQAIQGTQMGFYLDNAVPGLYDILNKQMQMMSFQKNTPEKAWDEIKQEYDKLSAIAKGQ
ncbi:ABC transporter substrate-binding protein [Cohnella cholangitidis]|uniref:Carbohydrate ABC transporter substrate-binding protein n=1 Tax=Cohnella cholangitidis TaxID=2598458 RepID=A0A7G5C496_9BACL|nr:ABC transporter substrate-binding protein [Cohnella cholangitidis]QMV44030.1 carbohydrate ABC transporter substrate-binding protein [Cohnella cholangitidis]